MGRVPPPYLLKFAFKDIQDLVQKFIRKETFENVTKMTSQMHQIAGNRGQFLKIFLGVVPQTSHGKGAPTIPSKMLIKRHSNLVPMVPRKIF